MQYYDEARAGNLRKALEQQVLLWPEVTTRRMFGCPAYMADRRLFAFLVTEGIVMTQLRKVDRELLAEKYETEFFKVGEREMPNWFKVCIPHPNVLEYALHFVRRSYEIALTRMK
ncbi:MAG: hypothetical protein JXA33_02700 [Anaerolineae bacterium]|nr:hypothetical protein [Anaerolineae bacterium]